MTDRTLIIGNKNYSSWSLRPWLLMKQGGISFAEVRIPLYTAASQAEIQRYSPAGKVPVLKDGDLTVWDSLAICEYAIAQYAPHLLPEDPQHKAIARSVSAEMHSGFLALRSRMPMNMRSRRQLPDIPTELQRDIDRVCSLWRSCRQNYGQSGDFLFGSFSLADTMYAPVVSRFTTYGVTLDPICQAYSDAIWNLPAMQEWRDAAWSEAEVIEDFDLADYAI
ncbi:glutathione S-transferase family protein [Roseofilum casamattae]|uniref:Glutathione S-transferase family protein n=1 Tax=Roseofilum casamattae BLCC-M143 TaxID=3022442 RepID=A0ABT7C3T3_9CYAN|nr:glutathione S-transferase family protein [Roseofilum casamattae]MDJ1185479.1 glutathione S-transferase family protein [Roseofilum casamattae BLCC-M143]